MSKRRKPPISEPSGYSAHPCPARTDQIPPAEYLPLLLLRPTRMPARPASLVETKAHRMVRINYCGLRRDRMGHGLTCRNAETDDEQGIFHRWHWLVTRMDRSRSRPPQPRGDRLCPARYRDARHLRGSGSRVADDLGQSFVRQGWE